MSNAVQDHPNQSLHQPKTPTNQRTGKLLSCVAPPPLSARPTGSPRRLSLRRRAFTHTAKGPSRISPQCALLPGILPVPPGDQDLRPRRCTLLAPASALHRSRRPRAFRSPQQFLRLPRIFRSVTSPPLCGNDPQRELALPTSLPRSPHPPASPAQRKNQEPASSPVHTTTAGLPQRRGCPPKHRDNFATGLTLG